MGVRRILATTIAVMTGSVALLAVVCASSITMPGGPTISVGSLRLSGQRLEPVELPYDPGPVAVTGGSSSAPSAEAVRQGEVLRQQALEAFGKARWAESIGLLQQALQMRPDDEALIKTLASARIALRWAELQERNAQETRQQAARDQVQVAGGLARLSEALASLRQQDSQYLIDRGEFEAALRLPTQADFMIDSSVVDLRDRQGVVNFAVLAPPPSVTGDVRFSTLAPRTEAPSLRKARKLLDSPALQSALFDERMGDAIGYHQVERAPSRRLDDPVLRAVADSLGIDLRHASGSQRALVKRKAQELWKAYDRSHARQAERDAELRDQSLNEYKAYLTKLTDQGIIRPDEDLRARERDYPAFGNLLRSQANRILLNEEVTRREIDRGAFDQLLSDVHSTMGAKP